MTTLFATPESRLALWALAVIVCTLCSASPAQAQIEYEQPPFSYYETEADNAVSQLQARIDAGEVNLEWDEEHGYLPAILAALEVDPASQMLVFSKTSFQLHRIRPSSPRAVYFNDESYVGSVRTGDVLEVSTADPNLGAVFYTLQQEPTEHPLLQRDNGQCMSCHATSRTQGVPGHLVRSVFPDDAGHPQLSAGSFTTDHTSPFEERWGGWYVTGMHGEMRHMGNVIAQADTRPDTFDREAGANITDLTSLVNTSHSLQPGSDLIALMVLEHQTQMHNFIARASYESRHAAHYDRIMNEALGRDMSHQSETTERRIAGAGEKLLEYLLFSGEFRLTSPIAGTSQFASNFEQRGPFDSRGRSLRQFDLQTRLFRYPCSYLIYSDAFDALPQNIRLYIANRLHDVLSGADQTEPFQHLSSEDRRAIWEILQETKPELLTLSSESD